MRQPTLLAQAWPRALHQVYWSGWVLRVRNTSTRPMSFNSIVIQARSSGVKPLFFWLLFQLRKSISWCAMLMSPTKINSRLALSFFRCGAIKANQRNLANCRSSPLDPLGK